MDKEKKKMSVLGFFGGATKRMHNKLTKHPSQTKMGRWDKCKSHL
jgi:hypothetical protein